MREFLFSPFIIPVAAFIMVGCIVALTKWHKVRERELQHEYDLRLKEMEHQQKMKAMELELARTKGGEAPQG